ncbi:sulfatase-like hydrolase/transferase [Lacrimispora brassicae]
MPALPAGRQHYEENTCDYGSRRLAAVRRAGKGYTPNLNALAKESTCFSDAYCTSPLCVPARGSLFTGLCPNSTGSLINPWEKEDEHAGCVRADLDNLYE